MSMVVQIHRVAEFFFLLLGALFIVAFLCWHQNTYPFYAEVYLRLADLPFAFFSILYALLSLRISFSYQYHGAERLYKDESHFPAGDTILFIIGFALLAAVIYADLFTANSMLFPQSFR